MSLVKTWYTLQEATEKFGVEEQRILEWVEQGMIRAEHAKRTVVRVNADDLDLKLQELTRI